MDAGQLIATASAGAAIVSAIIAHNTWKSSKHALTYHHLAKLMEDYEQPEIAEAVAGLHELAEREYPEGTFIEYCVKNIFSKQDKGVRHPLNQKRRKLMSFYDRMAVLYASGFLPKEVLFRQWTKQDLSIIPEVLIPLANVLYRTLNDGKEPPVEQYSLLQKLYEDSLK